MGKYEKNRKVWSSWLYYGSLVILLLVFLISGYYVWQYWAESKAASDRYDQLSAVVESVQQEQVTRPSLPASTEAAEPEILPEYAALYEQNDHLVGWIKIDGTVINYPVVQTPQEKDFYLRRDFDRNDSSHGTIYVNELCDVNEPSDNVTMYGHFMKDGSMFADLAQYWDREFWEDYPYIQFDTLTEHRTYEIFAIFRTTATLGEGFEYHNFIDAATAEDFDWFIRQCKSLAAYDTGITPPYGDQISCLATCEYTFENGRLVVAARLIAE